MPDPELAVALVARTRPDPALAPAIMAKLVVQHRPQPWRGYAHATQLLAAAGLRDPDKMATATQNYGRWLAGTPRFIAWLRMQTRS